MTSPVAHGEGDAVTLWRYVDCDVTEIGAYRYVEGPHIEGDEEYRALPAATYAALLARANTAKVAAELMRARAERAEKALRRIMAHPNAVFNVAAVGYGEPTILKIATEALSRLDAALGEG